MIFPTILSPRTIKPSDNYTQHNRNPTPNRYSGSKVCSIHVPCARKKRRPSFLCEDSRRHWHRRIRPHDTGPDLDQPTTELAFAFQRAQTLVGVGYQNEPVARIHTTNRLDDASHYEIFSEMLSFATSILQSFSSIQEKQLFRDQHLFDKNSEIAKIFEWKKPKRNIYNQLQKYLSDNSF